MTKKKLGVLILRAQPLHAGHRDLIRKSKSDCDTLLILVGSANSPRTIKNPFTYRERESEILGFINHEYSESESRTIHIYPLNDYRYSDTQWLSDVNSLVSDENSNNDKVVIFGHMKEGNFYLKWFPQYEFRHIDSTIDVHATGIRDRWFKDSRHKFHDDVLADYDYFQKEKSTFLNYPYPETLNFNCGDVILECSGHILLIQRKFAPGRNTWALPGGFKNANETFLDCAIRELMEETNVKVPEKVLRGSIVQTRMFDSPYRGMGLPRSTLAVHIKVSLNPDGSLPKANGSDDAMLAKWCHIEDIMNNMFLFDDHKDIISLMCGTMPVPAHKNPKYRFQN